MRVFTSLMVFTFMSIFMVASAQQAGDTVRVSVKTEKLFESPNGDVLGRLTQGTPVRITEVDGRWAKVRMEAWIWLPSTAVDTSVQVVEVDVADRPSLELVDFELHQVEVNYDAGRFNPELVMTMGLRNNTDKRITAWSAMLAIKNSFGEMLFQTGLRDGMADIAPGEIGDAIFRWEDDQFVDDEPYDRLSRYSKENLVLELSEIEVVY